MGAGARDAVSGHLKNAMGSDHEDLHAKRASTLSHSDEIKDALPASPTGETSHSSWFPDGHVAAPPNYESASGSAPGSSVVSPQRYGHPQVSSLTSPDQYDSQGYMRNWIPAPRPSMARPPMAEFASSQGPMSFHLGGSVHQLWNMDGAPASPPPLPNFDFFPSHPAPQHYVAPPPAPLSHKPSGPTSIYIPPQPGQPTTSHRHSLPSIVTSGHQNAAYHPLRTAPPQPHSIRTTFPRGYHEGSQQRSPQTYAPGSSPTRPLPAELFGSYCDGEGEILSDHERLRLRLLEEAYRNRPPPNSGGRRYGSTNHSPDEWANGGQRYVFLYLTPELESDRSIIRVRRWS